MDEQMKPMVHLLMLAEDWTINIDSKGGVTTELKGNQESLLEGIKLQADEAEVKEVTDNVKAEILRQQVKNFLGGIK